MRWLLATVLVLLCGSYVLALQGMRPLDDEARAALGGDYLSTPRGALSYTREGPATAPLVILVHGFSTPKFVWEQVTPQLLHLSLIHI